MHNKYLFMGGSWDGRRVNVENYQQKVRVVEKEIEGVFLMEDYDKHLLRSGKTKSFIFVESSISEDRFIEILIEGYKKK